MASCERQHDKQLEPFLAPRFHLANLADRSSSLKKNQRSEILNVLLTEISKRSKKGSSLVLLTISFSCNSPVFSLTHGFSCGRQGSYGCHSPAKTVGCERSPTHRSQDLPLTIGKTNWLISTRLTNVNDQGNIRKLIDVHNEKRWKTIKKKKKKLSECQHCWANLGSMSRLPFRYDVVLFRGDVANLWQRAKQ